MRKILEVAFHNHIQLILNLNRKLLYFNVIILLSHTIN